MVIKQWEVFRFISRIRTKSMTKLVSVMQDKFYRRMIKESVKKEAIGYSCSVAAGRGQCFKDLDALAKGPSSIHVSNTVATALGQV